MSREFSKKVKEMLGDAPDIVFEHVGQATFPTSVFTVKPFGKVVICAGTTGYNLDFDVRYLWMRQKEIIGSHFANAYECTKANELIESGEIRPVLWRTMPFEGVAEAHQLMKENKHLGKISILVGADKEGEGKTAEGPGADLRGGRQLMADAMVQIKWVANPFRDKFDEAWRPHAESVLKYGATWWAFLRAADGRLDFTQLALFHDKLDFDRYCHSEEIAKRAPWQWASSRCRSCRPFTSSRASASSPPPTPIPERPRGAFRARAVPRAGPLRYWSLTLVGGVTLALAGFAAIVWGTYELIGTDSCGTRTTQACSSDTGLHILAVTGAPSWAAPERSCSRSAAGRPGPGRRKKRVADMVARGEMAAPVVQRPRSPPPPPPDLPTPGAGPESTGSSSSTS